MGSLITIELNNLRFFAHHGLYESERKTGNEFKVDIKVMFEPDDKIIAKINQTIDYEQLFILVKDEMKKPTDLLETLAMNITSAIHSLFSQIKEIEIRIEKLHPPIMNFTGNICVTYMRSGFTGFKD